MVMTPQVLKMGDISILTYLKTCNVTNDHLPGSQMQAMSCYVITLMLLININNMYIPILCIQLLLLLLLNI